MALSDEVTARFGEAWLVEITNPQAPGFTTINTTKLNAACTDAVARMITGAAVAPAEFDLANPTHVATAVDGVIGLLLTRMGTMSDDAKRWMESFETGIKRLASIDHRDYVSPAVSNEAPRMPRSAGKYVIPERPNRSTSVGESNEEDNDA